MCKTRTQLRMEIFRTTSPKWTVHRRKAQLLFTVFGQQMFEKVCFKFNSLCPLKSCQPYFLAYFFLRYKCSTSTGNLRSHLMLEHKIEIPSINVDTRQKKMSDMFAAKPSTSSGGASSVSTLNPQSLYFKFKSYF